MISFIKDLLNLGKDTMETAKQIREFKPYAKTERLKNGDIIFKYGHWTEYGINHGFYTIKKQDPYNFMNLHNPKEWKPKREIFI